MAETVSVQTSDEVVSLTGYVNGVYLIFQESDPVNNTWTATADRSPDGRYVMILTATDNLGNASTIETVQYLVTEPWGFKTDWKSTDFYNYYDLDRVEANIRFLRNYLVGVLKYDIPDFGNAPLRSYDTIDFLDGINKIEDDIETLRQTVGTPQGYMGFKDWTVKQTFDYNDAIRLELNVKQLYEMAQKINGNFIYSGTRYAGQGGIY